MWACNVTKCSSKLCRPLALPRSHTTRSDLSHLCVAARIALPLDCLSSAGAWELAAPYGNSPTRLNLVPWHTSANSQPASTLPASQQLVGAVTPAFDQPRTHALPLPLVCHLLGSGNQLHPAGLYQPALPLSHRTPIGHRTPLRGNVEGRPDGVLSPTYPWKAPVRHQLLLRRFLLQASTLSAAGPVDPSRHGQQDVQQGSGSR